MTAQCSDSVRSWSTRVPDMRADAAKASPQQRYVVREINRVVRKSIPQIFKWSGFTLYGLFRKT